MATGRIGVTPTLGTRWSKAPAGGTTSLSGLDDNSVSLVYSVGYEQVYRNGVLLSRGNDYTATTGNSITLIDATIAGDIIEVFANELVPLTDAISKGQFTAKGALLSATAASTPAVLTVGSNDQVLTADSTTSTGLKWATPSAGGQTLLSTTSLSGASTTISSISQSYNDLYVFIDNPYLNTAGTYLSIQPNSTANLADFRYMTWTGGAQGNFGQTATDLEAPIDLAATTGVTRNKWLLKIYSYTNTTYGKMFEMVGTSSNGDSVIILSGGIRTASAITELKITTTAPGSRTFSGGQVRIYGVK